MNTDTSILSTWQEAPIQVSLTEILSKLSAEFKLIF